MKLNKQQRAQIQRLIILQDHHRTLATEAERRIAVLLKEYCGADIVNEQWELDIDKGVLKRATTNGNPQQ